MYKNHLKTSVEDLAVDFLSNSETVYHVRTIFNRTSNIYCLENTVFEINIFIFSKNTTLS